MLTKSFTERSCTNLVLFSDAIDLSDPRNRNPIHKSLAIGNHNFEVATIHTEIAIRLPSRNHRNALGKVLVMIGHHDLVVPTSSGWLVSSLVERTLNRKAHTNKQTNWWIPSQKSDSEFKRVFSELAVIFELQLPSLVVYDFEVAAVRVAKASMRTREKKTIMTKICKPERLGEESKIGKSPKVVRRGCERPFGPTTQRSPKSLLHHVQKAFRSLGSKDLLHPSPNYFRGFSSFLVGAFIKRMNGPRKRNRTNRENQGRVPELIRKILEILGKSQERTKKEGQVQIGKHPNTPSGFCHRIKFQSILVKLSQS